MSLLKNCTISKKAIYKIPKYLKEKKCTKATLFTDPNIYQKYGSELEETIKKQDIIIDKIIVPYKNFNLDSTLISKDTKILLALGGGRVIDYTKTAAAKSKTPWISIPTSLSHDGIISNRASLEEKRKRTSKKATPPEHTYIDLEIIMSAPRELTISGIGDVIAKHSSLYDWELAIKRGLEKKDKKAKRLIKKSIKKLDKIDKKLAEAKSFKSLAQSLVYSGMAMNHFKNSRPASGSEHTIAHAMSQLGINMKHGKAVALATLFTTALQAEAEGQEQEKSVKEKMEKMGLPTTLKKAGVSEESFIKAVLIAPNLRQRHTILNETELDEGKIRKMLKKTGMVQ